MRIHDSLNRRDWLRHATSVIAAGTFLRTSPLLLAETDDRPANRLIVRQEKPFNAEPALPDLLDNWLTPYGTFFQRSHGNVPHLAAKDHRLIIEGLVEKPLTFSLSELIEKFPARSVVATITCAGNRRSEFPPEPKISGVKWTGAAISNAEWEGVSLADLLKHVGLKAEAKHVWFDALDEITEGGKTFAFGASIPIDKALAGGKSPEALLAHRMNRAPLPKEHGGPLRGVVSGYIGARSVKWLGKITVSDQPSPNHYVADVYKLVTQTTEEQAKATTPIYQHALNSVTCRWALDQGRAAVKVTGFALPFGQADCLIRNVDVSLDDGKTWIAAKLTSPQRDFCWTFWEATLPAEAVGKTLLVKATDTRGEVQPREMPYNAKGYQYNAWHRVTLDV